MTHFGQALYQPANKRNPSHMPTCTLHRLYTCQSHNTCTHTQGYNLRLLPSSPGVIHTSHSTNPAHTAHSENLQTQQVQNAAEYGLTLYHPTQHTERPQSTPSPSPNLHTKRTNTENNMPATAHKKQTLDKAKPPCKRQPLTHDPPTCYLGTHTRGPSPSTSTYNTPGRCHLAANCCCDSRGSQPLSQLRGTPELTRMSP